MELLLATGNLHKKQEFEKLLSQWTILTPEEAGLQFFCDETGKSFSENALQKAEALYRVSGKAVIADDSGLSVDSLNGRPGIHSARYGDTDTKKLTSIEKYNLLLAEMKGTTDRSAAFICSLVLMIDPDRFFVFQETCTGVISEKPSGSGGFGYDPVFYLPELGRTMAELTEDEKNSISHRGMAGKALSIFLDNYGDSLGLV